MAERIKVTAKKVDTVSDTVDVSCMIPAVEWVDEHWYNSDAVDVEAIRRWSIVASRGSPNRNFNTTVIILCTSRAVRGWPDTILLLLWLELLDDILK